MTEFAGKLIQRIEIWQRSQERLSSGASSETWQYRARCLAAIDAEGPASTTEAMTLSAMPRYRVTIRVGIAAEIDQQVRWQGRCLSVRQIVSDPRYPDRLTLRCEEQR